MAAGEPPPPPTGMGILGLLSFRRAATAVASFDPAHDDDLRALDCLQSHVAEPLAAMAAEAQGQQHVLSVAVLSKLMDAVLSSEAAFRDVLAVAPVAAALSRPPADRLAQDLLDRAVKSLDVLNAVSMALASMRGSHRTALTAASCLLAPSLHRAHLSRARRAISRLFPDTTKAAAAGASSSPSFSRAARALSSSVSRNWSAGRHVHSMAAHLAPPTPAPSAASTGAGGGLGLALYTMSSVLVFSMWALVAAVPCQDRASTATSPPVAPPKQAQWAGPMVALQERIGEEWRRGKKGSSSGSVGTTGLLSEMQALELAAGELMRLLEEIAEEEEDDAAGWAVAEERAQDVRERAEQLAAACGALENGLAPLERQVRAVFHRVVASRAEVMRCLEHSARTAHASPASVSGVRSHHSF